MATRATGSARVANAGLCATHAGRAAGGDPPASGRRRRGASTATATSPPTATLRPHRRQPRTARPGSRRTRRCWRPGRAPARVGASRMRCPSARSTIASANGPNGPSCHHPTTTRTPLVEPTPAIRPRNRCRVPTAPSSPLGSGHGSGPHLRGSTPGSSLSHDAATAAREPGRQARLRPRLGGDRLLRHGPGAPAPALPDRPARRGRRRRGPGRVPAQGLGRHPQPDRGPDQRPLDQPRPAGAARSSSASGTLLSLAFVLLFAGPTSPTRPRRHLGRRAVPRAAPRPTRSSRCPTSRCRPR